MSSAMFTALTALQSNQTQMETIADNVANLNTPGFKVRRAQFADLLAEEVSFGSVPASGSGGVNPQQIGMGVRVHSIDPMMTQGSLMATGDPLNAAIEGAGFFVVKNGSQLMFTRDGSFRVDADGNLVQSGTGFSVHGFLADSSGVVTPSSSTVALKVPVGLTLEARATSSGGLAGNLDADAASGATFTSSFDVYDSLGSRRAVSMTFTKTGASEWGWSATSGGSAAGTGTITFDSNGVTSATGNLSIPITGGGASPLTVALDMARVTQLASSTSVNLTSQDGFSPGVLESVVVDSRGVLRGLFSNGQTRAFGQMAVATFNNPQGLQRAGNNLFAVSNNSGSANIGEAGAQGRGVMHSGMLEQSNVDLANELTRALVTERNFQAASRLITTSDEMMQDVISIKR